ncbi:MAG: histidine kinase [Saprospiraceae bacterium]
MWNNTKSPSEIVLGAWPRALLLFLIYHPFSMLSGQETNPWEIYNLNYKVPDSIALHLASISGNKNQAEYLLKEIEKINTSDYKMALFLIEEALNLTKSGTYALIRAQLRYWKAFIYNREDPEGEFLQLSLSEAQNGQEEFERQNANYWLAKTYSLRASIYYNMAKDSLAMLYNDKALNISQALDSSREDYYKIMGEIYRIRGNILIYMKDSADSTKFYYQRSQEFYKKIKDSLHIALLYLNEGIVFTNKGLIEEPPLYFKNAIRIYEKLGKKEDLAKAYLEYATYFASQYNSTKEETFFLRSNVLLKKGLSLEPTRACELYYQLGSNYQSFASFHFKDKPTFNLYSDTAIAIYEKNLRIAVNEQNLPYFRKTAKAISLMCPYLENKKCSTLIDTTNSNYEQILKASLAVRDTVAQKNLLYRDEIAVRQQRQTITWASGTALFTILGISFIYYRSRIKNLNKVLENRMEALRAQMNPHFISNCLNAIDSLINQERNEEASEYIIDFSRLCRMVLNNSKEKWITLEEEIETLQYFINLEKLRLGDDLTYSINVDDNINQSEIRIPPMLLQPFVENAIWHGIQKKQGPGYLEVAVFRNEAQLLECHIIDDGIGRQRAKELQDQSVLNRPSWGMNITQERMDSYKNIKGATFSIADYKPGEENMPGTKVTITLPLTPN